MSLATFTKVQRLSSKGSLINFALSCPGEGKAIIFQLPYRRRSFSAHVLDGILQCKKVPFHLLLKLTFNLLLKLPFNLGRRSWPAST